MHMYVTRKILSHHPTDTGFHLNDLPYPEPPV